MALGSDGSLSATFIGKSGATTALVFDVTGYFLPNASGDTYHSIAPLRLLDSRLHYNQGGVFRTASPGVFQAVGPIIPDNAVAVTGNLTVAAQTSAGYVSLGPISLSAPTTSTLNVPAADVRANGVAVALGLNGTLSATFVGKGGSSTALIFDATGYFAP